MLHSPSGYWQTKVLRREDPYLKVGETNDRAHKGSSEYVWALKDINFKVEQGDVVGIIGRNGAGKKLFMPLCRIFPLFFFVPNIFGNDYSIKSTIPYIAIAAVLLTFLENHLFTDYRMIHNTNLKDYIAFCLARLFKKFDTKKSIHKQNAQNTLFEIIRE